jgi:hypothetical protein
MKKIYFSFLLFLFIAFTKGQTAPTCSLDPIFMAVPKAGIWPDSVTNFISGNVGQPYIQNITVKVPLDTPAVIGTACFNRFVLLTPTANYDLPPGLQFGSSTSTVSNGTVNGASSLKFAGNSSQCASIYGTPTVAGTYTLKLVVEVYANIIFTGNCPAVPNVSGGTKLQTNYLNYYIIKIDPPAGINENVNSRSLDLQNSPNPFTAKTNIKFSVKDESTAQLKVFDVLGKTVYSDSFKTKFGENNYEFDGSKLNEGMYFYTISYKSFSETKRMIISQN